MELSQTQITDHSSERIEFEPDTPHPDWEDNLTAIIEAKDEQIKRLQLGNLCFMNRAKHLEGKVEDLEAALEEARDQFVAINQVLTTAKYIPLAEAELVGVFKLLQAMADEGESSANHDLAMANLSNTDNGGTDSED